MENAMLVRLNFEEVLRYNEMPRAMPKYPAPMACRGFCTCCEQSGLLKAGGRLELMSHGCDSSDFKHILGEMPGNPSCRSPFSGSALFLLENPGADYGNGNFMTFNGYRKQAPNNGYYWSPEEGDWPRGLNDIAHFYGPYFAYLMWKHQLSNVYITNASKCKYVGDGETLKKVERNCMSKFLSREVKELAPKLVLCFGRPAESAYNEGIFKTRIWETEPVYLYHPSAIMVRAAALRSTKQELMDKNDERIRKAVLVANGGAIS